MPQPVPPALFDQFVRGWRGYVLVALIALVSGLFGAARVPVMDVDEARFAQASRQMIESGDYVQIRLQDQARNKKPVGIHWLQAAATQALAPFTHKLNAIWTYRLPSALGAALAAAAALWGGAALLGHRRAFFGAALFAAGMMLGVEAMTAKTDAVLVGFTTLAIAALARLRVSSAHPRLLALVFWGALACGALIKGPITPIVVALTLLTLAIWERRAAWMKPLLWWGGPLLALVIGLPWAIAIGVATHGQFYADALGVDLAPKLAGRDHAHRGLPGYYTLLLPLLIFPATYALPAAARLAWAAIRAPRADAAQAPYRFLLAWAVPTFLMFELLPGKLVHYTLPTYPAIALLCGAGLAEMLGRRWRTAHPIGLVLFGVVGLVFVALMAAVTTFTPGDMSADLRRSISAGLIGAVIVAGAFAVLLLMRRPVARLTALVACALALSFSLRERLIPDAHTLFVSNDVVAALARARLTPREGRELWVVGYDEPSIVFLTRTSTHLVRPDAAAAGARAGDGMVIEGRKLADAQSALAEHNLFFAQTEEVRGFSLGDGKPVLLIVGRVTDTPSGEAAASPPRSP